MCGEWVWGGNRLLLPKWGIRAEPRGFLSDQCLPFPSFIKEPLKLAINWGIKLLCVDIVQIEEYRKIIVFFKLKVVGL